MPRLNRRIRQCRSAAKCTTKAVRAGPTERLKKRPSRAVQCLAETAKNKGCSRLRPECCHATPEAAADISQSDILPLSKLLASDGDISNVDMLRAEEKSGNLATECSRPVDKSPSTSAAKKCGSRYHRQQGPDIEVQIIL
jgi:hypothetical protein